MIIEPICERVDAFGEVARFYNHDTLIRVDVTKGERTFEELALLVGIGDLQSRV